MAGHEGACTWSGRLAACRRLPLGTRAGDSGDNRPASMWLSRDTATWNMCARWGSGSAVDWRFRISAHGKIAGTTYHGAHNLSRGCVEIVTTDVIVHTGAPTLVAQRSYFEFEFGKRRRQPP